MKRWLACLTVLILIPGLGLFHYFSTLPGPLHGDEIHYLAMTVSLVRDGDLNLINNYQSQEIQDLAGGPVEPHLIYLKNGQGYSSHEPGLAALLAIPYAIDGRRGAVIFMMILAIIAAMQIYWMAGKSGASAPVAMLLTLSAAFTVPFGMMSGKFFPDMAGATFLALACSWMLMDDRRSRHVAGAFAVAILPWLHIKFAIFTGLMIPAFLLIRRPRIRDLGMIIGPAVLSITGLAIMHYLLFHDWLYMIKVKAGGMGNPYPGVAGLLFDRETGLLVFAPVFVPALAGMLLLKKRSPAAIVIALICLVFWIISGSWIDWHSGHCPPARYLTPLIPLVAVYSACVFRKPISVVRVAAWGILWVISMLQLAGVAMSIPESAIVQNDGINRLWTRYLPEIFQTMFPSWLVPAPGMGWKYAGLGLAAGAALAMFILPGPAGRRRLIAIAGALCLSATAMTVGSSQELRYRRLLDAIPLSKEGPELVHPRPDTVWWAELPDLEWKPLEGADGYICKIEFPDGRTFRIPKYGETRIVIADSVISTDVVRQIRLVRDSTETGQAGSIIGKTIFSSFSMKTVLFDEMFGIENQRKNQLHGCLMFPEIIFSLHAKPRCQFHLKPVPADRPADPANEIHVFVLPGIRGQEVDPFQSDTHLFTGPCPQFQTAVNIHSIAGFVVLNVQKLP